MVACALLGIALPFASLAATMSSQNYVVDFSRIGADQLFAVSDGTSEHYSVIPADNTIADQNTNTPPANTNSAKPRKDQRDVFEQAQTEVGGSIQDENVNGSAPPPSSDTSPATDSAKTSSSWREEWARIAVILSFAWLLTVVVIALKKKKLVGPWREYNIR